MKHHEYEKVRAGAIVRTNCTIRSRNIEIPAGVEMEVMSKRSGLNLAAPRCECCGIRPFIMRVPAREVDLVRHANQPTSEEG